MKVVGQKRPQTFPVSQFDDGQCFEYDGDLYLLVNADTYVSEDDITHHVFCVELETGDLVRLGKDTEVVSMANRVKVVVE